MTPVKPKMWKFQVEISCNFGSRDLSCQLRPSDEKLVVWQNIYSRSITTKKQLKSALGLINFCRGFYSSLCADCSSSYCFDEENQPEKNLWTVESEKASNDLEESAKSDRRLYAPDQSKPYQLFTDESFGTSEQQLLGSDNNDSSGCLRQTAN